MAPQTRNHPPTPANSTANDDEVGTPASGAGDVKLRRAHRKSRNGCKECKRRHVKCDETRPTCVNCATAERHCSYLDSLPASARAAVPAKRVLVTDGHTPASSVTQAAMGANPVSASSPSVTTVVNDFIMRTGETSEVASPANGQFFTMEHLRLFRHFATHMPSFAGLDEFLKPIIDMTIDVALSAPYLMDVMLANAAMHLAETNPSRADYYRLQATQLQTRGLMLFNEAKEEISEETCIPMFLFAATVGNQTLCETLRTNRDDFNAFLDQFAWYLSLHRGVCTVTGSSWHIIRQSGAKEFLDFLDARHPQVEVPEIGLLYRMLDQADLGPASLEACRAAADILAHAYAIYRSISERSRHQSSSVMAFGSRITTGFIDVLKQRRPEALVILAYYAVLLHWCREYWVFGDAGQFMIRSISAHLGDYWSEWLAFPNSVLEDQQQQQHAG
ncbi:Upc2 protein [Colletotrichum truncatum]|uniref:Upc2 protein n=1 Tax=Colletotrichum truncatum TaxID=5467 RepID=A0ACC3ZBX1_COLTU|nr:Upc2 protein [Colletotrichum truncatum]KAF6787723.1 Upc2 protein [Colletotrichum truncatum]